MSYQVAHIVHVYSKHGSLIWGTHVSVMHFDRLEPVLFGEWSILTIMETQVMASTKRISVGEKWSNHGTRMESV